MAHEEIWQDIRTATSLDDITNCLRTYFISLGRQSITKDRDEASRLTGLNLINTDLQSLAPSLSDEAKDQVLHRLKTGVEIILEMNPKILAGSGYVLIQTFIETGSADDLKTFMQKHSVDSTPFFPTV